MTTIDLGKDVCLLKCPHCGKEIVDEDVSFCPKCGESLGSQEKRTDLVLASGMLTIISAAFSAGLAYLALYRMVLFLGLNYAFSALTGFLIVGILSIAAAVLGIAAGVFMLKRKYINLSMLGIILLLVSAFGNYITIHYYGYTIQYGFTEVALFCEIIIIIFSLLSGVFVASSKTEFA